MRYPVWRAPIVGVATGALVLALLPGAPGDTAVRAEARIRPQIEQRDADGRVVRSRGGKRTTYRSSPKAPRPGSTRARAGRAAVPIGARYVSAEPDAPSLTLEWNRAALGEGIGLTGLFAADVDADGTVEIVTGGAAGGFVAQPTLVRPLPPGRGVRPGVREPPLSVRRGRGARGPDGRRRPARGGAWAPARACSSTTARATRSSGR